MRMDRFTTLAQEALAAAQALAGAKSHAEMTPLHLLAAMLEDRAGIASSIMNKAGLNADRIPSPGSSWNRTARRRSGWLASAINGDPSRGLGILNNDLYRGVLVWNRSRWIRSASGGWGFV